MSLTAKFTLFTSLLCVIIISGVTFISHKIGKKALGKSIGERLEAIVSSAAPFIDGDLHNTIKGKEDVSSEAFLTLREQLRTIKAANNLREEVYTFRKVGNELHYIVMTNQDPLLGQTYAIRPEMTPTLAEGRSTFTPAYKDEHDSWISAYAPIFDSKGTQVGLLEADVKLGEFEQKVWEHSRELVIYGSIVGILAILLSYFLSKTITRKLNYLTDITERISLGHMEKAIVITGTDEVAKLGASLERMRESLIIAADMIQ